MRIPRAIQFSGRTSVVAGAFRSLGAFSLILLVVFFTAAATFFSSGASFLSIWIVILVFGGLGAALLIFAPEPSHSVERLSIAAIALFVFLAAVWPRYAAFRLPGMPELSPARISLLLLLLLGAYLVAKSPAMRARLFARVARFRMLFVALAVLVTLKVIGIPFSAVPLASLRGVANEVVTVYLPLLLVLAAIETRRDVHLILLAFLAAAAVVVLVGFVEYRVGRNLFFTLFDIDSDYLANILRDKDRAGAYRLQSTFAHPLTLSEFLVVVTPVAVYMAFFDGVRLGRALLLAVLLAAMGFVVIKSGSRSGIGSLVVIMGICALFLATYLSIRSRDALRSALYVLAAIAILLVAAIGVYLILDILVGRTAREYNSGAVRLYQWTRGLQLWAEQPVLGYGQDLAAQVLGFVGSHGTITIDSYYLSVLLDNGLPALLVYALMLVALAAYALRAGFNRHAPDLLPALLVASIVGFILVKGILSLNHNHGLFMVLMGTMLSAIAIHAPVASAGKQGTSPRVSRLAVAR